MSSASISSSFFGSLQQGLPLAPVVETSTLPVSMSMRTSHHSGWLSKIGLVEPPWLGFG